LLINSPLKKVKFISPLLCPYPRRLGSIVTETLKNGILIPIDTSKEADFYFTDFKHIYIYIYYQVSSYPSKVKSLRKFALFL
jgi:hypothetical protein